MRERTAFSLLSLLSLLALSRLLHFTTPLSPLPFAALYFSPSHPHIHPRALRLSKRNLSPLVVGCRLKKSSTFAAVSRVQPLSRSPPLFLSLSPPPHLHPLSPHNGAPVHRAAVNGGVRCAERSADDCAPEEPNTAVREAIAREAFPSLLFDVSRGQLRGGLFQVNFLHPSSELRFLNGENGRGTGKGEREGPCVLPLFFLSFRSVLFIEREREKVRELLSDHNTFVFHLRLIF